MKIVIFGLTITSSWGNGHATTYRSLCKALHARGHHIQFIEKDVEWYRSNRDLPVPEYCKVQLYEAWEPSVAWLTGQARDADVIVIGSYYPDAIIATHALLDAGCTPLLFYDIDTPITMKWLRLQGGCHYLDGALIPQYAAYLSFTGGPVLQELETCFGSPCAVPLYCSVDADLYGPRAASEAYRCDLSYLGTYAADRQPKLMEFLNRTAEMQPHKRFLVAGPQYPSDISWQPNVDRITHLSPPEHPAFYSSARFTLNLTRDEMVAAGYSPSVRLFEASACGATILSDRWNGLEDFLSPGREILVPADAYEVAAILTDLPEAERIGIGRSARDHILAEHTSEHRAIQFENMVSSLGT